MKVIFQQVCDGILVAALQSTDELLGHNSRRRLQLHYGEAAAIEYGPVSDGWHVAIELPLDSVPAARPARISA